MSQWFPPQTDPVCARCAQPIGDDFITVHRKDDFQAIAVCPTCATPKERIERDERRARGTNW